MQTYMRFLVCSVINLIMILSMVGCSINSESRSESELLQVEWSNREGDFTLLIAQEKGFFNKYGVNIKPIYYEQPSKALSDLGAGKIDGGLLSLDDVIRLSRIIDLKAIAVYDSGGTSAVVAAPEINRVADLKGKKVGVIPGTKDELFVRQMLAEAGLTYRDVIFVNISPDQVPISIPKVIQAGFTSEHFISESMEKGHKLLAATSYTSPTSLTPNLIVFNLTLVDKDPEKIRSFLNAWFEALDYRRKEPVECNQIIANFLGVGIEDIESGKAKLFDRNDNFSFFRDNPGEDISSIFYSTQITIDFLISTGVITQKPDINQLLDSSYLH